MGARHPRAHRNKPGLSGANDGRGGQLAKPAVRWFRLLALDPTDDLPIPRPFELAGRFAGFVFTEAGKRRMRLCEGEHEHLLKVPRTLRRRIFGKFQPSQPIRVAGMEEQDPVTARLKRVVSRVLPDTAGIEPAPALPTTLAACTIRVCAKKNCWRQGGREFWDTLGRELAARGLADRIKLRQVGCLDRCKQAPNADCGDHAYTRCTPADATRVIDRAMPGHAAKRRSPDARTVIDFLPAVPTEIL